MHSLNKLFVFGYLVMVSVYVHANYSSLLNRSPFLPPDFNLEHEPTLREELTAINFFELKGVSKIGSIYSFAVLDKRSNECIWIKQNEEINGFSVTSYDPTEIVITFQWNGRIGTTELMQPDYASAYTSNTSAYTSNTPESEYTQNHQYARTERNRSVGENKQGHHSTVHARANTPVDVNPQLSQHTPLPENRVIYFHRSGNAGTKQAPTRQPGMTTSVVTLPGLSFASDKLHSEENNYQPVAADQNTDEAPLFKINRRITVNNPTGKRPDHLNYVGLL